MPYTVPEEFQPVLSYPPEKLVDQLLNLKRPGQATVITDQPRSNHYVAVLVTRSQPDLKKFRKQYSRSGPDAVIYNQLVSDRVADYRKSVIEQLRREASGGNVKDNGLLDIPESIRKRDSGRYEED